MNYSTTVDFLDAVHNRKIVNGLTHNFYRYPARFSPLFARAAIQTFTEPGDVVLDPFMGGGTTLVEARALGRRAIGTDISELATFVSRVKTAPLSERDLSIICSWAGNLGESLSCHKSSKRADEWIKQGYQRNISNKSTWPIRKTIEQILASIEDLPRERQQKFARCTLLKSAQWALDSRKKIPTAEQFRCQFFIHLTKMILGAKDFSIAVQNSDRLYPSQTYFRTLCLNRSVAGIENDERITNIPSPKLIVTSPPYPGVHVLYHRWQVQGRRETPAPFWIANGLDGSGASFYTFGDRKSPKLETYFEQALISFASLSRISDHKTLLVQMLAFSDPSWQLPKYLSMMEEAGFRETNQQADADSPDGRIWRCVPNRKWHANQKGEIAASKEVVLFHRLSRRPI